jgi:hypothetical protein
VTIERDLLLEAREALHDRLVQTYRVAMVASHGGARVQIHVGSAVESYFKNLCSEVEGWAAPVDRTTLWGYPVVVDERYQPDHIGVHTVVTIP